MLKLSDKWIDLIQGMPETGMGYHVVSIVLGDGRRFDRCVFDSGFIAGIKGLEEIPFNETRAARGL